MAQYAKYLLLIIGLPAMIRAQSVDTSGLRISLQKASTALDAVRFEEAAHLADSLILIVEQCEDDAPLLLAEAHHIAGHSRLEQGEYSKVLYHFEEALRLATNAKGLNHEATAQALSDLGYYYFEKREITTALPLFENALTLRKRILGTQHPKTVDTYNNIGNCYQVLGQFDIALSYYRQTQEARKLLYGENDPQYASACNNVANALLSMGDYNEAMPYYKRALAVRVVTLGVDNPKTGQSYQSMGNIFFELEQPDSAQYYFEKALLNYGKNYGEQHLRTADIYENLGNCAMSRLHYTEALQWYEKALQPRITQLGASHPKVAQGYAAMGGVLLEQEQASAALVYLRKALAILADKTAEQPLLLANVLEQTGLALRTLERFDEALRNHTQAMLIRQSILGKYHPLVAEAYSHIGNCYWAKQLFAPALENYQTSLEIQSTMLQANNPDLAAIWSNIGNCYLKLNQLEEAEACFEKSLIPGNQLPAFQLATYLNQLAILADQRNQFEKAFPLFSQALSLLRYNPGSHLSAPVEVILVLTAQADTYLHLFKECSDPDDLHRSREVYQQAIALLINTAARSSDSDTRRRLTAQNRSLFEGAIEAAFLTWQLKGDLAYLEEAFQLSEQCKSVRLLTSMTESTLPAPAQAMLDQLLTEQRMLEKQRNHFVNTAGSDSPEVLTCDSLLFILQVKRDSLISQLQSHSGDNPRQLITSGVDLASIRSLLKKGQTLAAFFWGSKALYAFVVSADSLKALRLEEIKPIYDNINIMRVSICDYPKASEREIGQLDTLYATSAYDLYQHFWQPLQYLLGASTHIIISPDVSLGFLPFDAILTREPKEIGRYRNYPYLLRKFEISYTYSAVLLWWSHRHKPNRWKRRCLAVAPDFSQDSRRLAELPYNQLETKSVINRIGGRQLTGEDAILSRFLAIANKYRILHLATHGHADQTNGDYSYLAFNEIKDSLDNEYLYVKELSAYHMDADLVVLSACESGVGAYQSGEGFISVARGFAYAGARSILTTLWSVNDARVASIMDQFYRHLCKGQAKDEALYQTKLQYLSQATHEAAHPFFWATYSLIGDTGPLPWGVRFNRWWGMLFVGMIGVGVFFFRRNKFKKIA